MRVALVVSLVIFSLTLVACGGGGGGGGGGRTTGTGMRVIHASLDLPPVVVSVNGSEIARASYLSSTFYSGVSAGPATVTIEFQNQPGAVFSSLNVRFTEGQEHTLLLSGEARTSNFRAILIPEEVVQAVSGNGRVQLINGFTSGGSLRLDFVGGIGEGVGPGNLSQAVELASGAQQVSVVDGSNSIASSTIDLPDQGEVTVVVSGSRAEGVVLTELVNDLD